MRLAGAIALTSAQRSVVEHPLGKPGLVDAGAGTGKTFTIVERVAALDETKTCPADKILLLTFARKAAAELRARIARRLNDKTPTCSTFHAFAWSILSSHAYDVGISPETTILEDADARVEFHKAFDEFLDDPKAAASGFPLRTFNCEEIRTSLFRIDQKLKQDGMSIAAFRERALTAADVFGAVRYRELLEPYRRPQQGKTHKTVAQTGDDAFQQEMTWEKARIDACADILRRFSERLAARNALTYADILVRAEKALRENDALRSELRERYRCCIVDEYQDTDRAQHRLLEALFGSGLASVMVVGDALQSIFSFRGAQPENVAVFSTAPEAVRYTLVENRRSRQEILDLAYASVAVAHNNAQALRGERGHAGEQIVHLTSLWTPGAARYLPADEARKLEATAVAQRIRHLLASGQSVAVGERSEPISPRHIAILSRTKKNVQPITRALLDASVPFKLVGGVGFYEAPEIRDVLAWIRLLANPFDSLAVARALQSSAIGASDATVTQLARGSGRDETAFARRALIEDLAETEFDAPVREAAHKMRRLLDALAPYAALPLVGALRAVLEATGIEREYRERLGPRAEQARANLTKLEALARSFAAQSPDAQPADFVSFMNELELVDFDEREADVSSSDAVTIATIHAAKGLEWPFVFVLGVWPKLPGGPRLFMDEKTGALLYAENPDGSRSFHYDSVTRAADEQGLVPRKESSKENPEERRLLYVALTRARDRLFISGLRLKPSKAHPHGKPHDYVQEIYDWLSAQAWVADEFVPPDVPTLVPDFLSMDQQPTSQPSSAQPTRLTGSGAALSARETTLTLPLSYSLLARYERCPRQATYKVMLRLPEVSENQKEKRPEPRTEQSFDSGELAGPDSLLGAGEYGQVLHKALELWAVDKRNKISVKSPAAYLDDATRLLAIAIPKKQRDEAQSALQRSILELREWQPVHIEAPFTLDFGEEGRPLLVSGYLDLLAKTTKGQACLIDYKTGDQAVDHALQLALYRRAADEVYGMKNPACFVGQIDGKDFTLRNVEPVAPGELRARILAVRDGLLAREHRAIAGPWCWTCGYRDAPCRDYRVARE